MPSLARLTTATGLGLLLLVASPARSQDACSGPYKGRSVTPEELADVLAAHQKWLEKEADGRQANLCGAILHGATLPWVDLIGADLQETALHGADLHRANLLGVNLHRATLFGANLHKAILHSADLQQANLQEADLTEADLYDAEVSATIFEPRFLPDVQRMAFARHLVDLRFATSPHALQALQEAFKTTGWRHQERAVTYAIRHTQRCQAWPVFCPPEMASAAPEFFKKVYGAFQLLAFEWPCAYGMAPARPLGLLMGLLLGGAGLHMLALSARGRTGMWVLKPAEPDKQQAGHVQRVRITRNFFCPRLQARCAGRWWGLLVRWGCVLLFGGAFSLLSAFYLGGRDLNIGNWIARRQSREYTLRATGWVRVVSGGQFLLSVYLLALWALTSFGRPFA
jgi:hypothetical protein